MKSVHHNLFVGNQEDYESFPEKDNDKYSFVLAAKFPWHRDALGYKIAAEKENKEYLVAKRDNKLILNLIDPKDPAYVSAQCVKAGVDFIGQELRAGKTVGVFCNKGESRSPALALLYLRKKGIIDHEKAIDGIDAFKMIYPDFKPSEGVTGFIEQHWSFYNG